MSRYITPGNVHNLVHQESLYSVYLAHATVHDLKESSNYVVVNNQYDTIEAEEECLPEAIAKCKYYSDVINSFKDKKSLDELLSEVEPDGSNKHH